jgi:hypothetical protein
VTPPPGSFGGDGWPRHEPHHEPHHEPRHESRKEPGQEPRQKVTHQICQRSPGKTYAPDTAHHDAVALDRGETE